MWLSQGTAWSCDLFPPINYEQKRLSQEAAVQRGFWGKEDKQNGDSAASQRWESETGFEVASFVTRVTATNKLPRIIVALCSFSQDL